jgi:uncharacterized metal-binding protein YceD (DUF177 family)
MAEAPLFAVPVADLDYGEREIDEEIPVAWLGTAFFATEAVPNGQPGRLVVTVSKSGREVMVRGRARAQVSMPCARTLDPVRVNIESEIFLLLRPGAPALPQSKQEKPRKKQVARALVAPRAPRRERDEDKPLSDTDAAEDTYDGEKVVLDRFIQEFLVLELPMFPLREDLRSEATPAIERPSGEAEIRPEREAIDPRLAPLAAIASRLRDKKE